MGILVRPCLKSTGNTDARELAAALHFPKVRRLFFFSYIVTAERIGSDLILTDPLREKASCITP